MRIDSADFNSANTSTVKEPRFVVAIEYPVDSIYITSHTGIAGVPGTVIEGALQEPSIVSQRLNPIEGRSEIGSASFQVVDLGAALTDEIRERLNDDVGLRNRTVRFYLGYAGLAFADFVMVGTQQVSEATYERGRYQISCADIQRSAKKDIFDLAETNLAQSVSDSDTTIYVTSTTGFSTVYHGPTYSDAANSTVGYIKIRDEVIRYTGKTSTSFTGCARGALGTIASKYDVDAATPAARREKVTEHVYLELPAVKLAYAILTGTLYGDAATLPSTWHLGIDAALIRLSDFTQIGSDMWDAANGGIIIRFEGIKKTDGKKFLEEEICRLLGVFMPVYANGALGLRRASRVLSDAAPVATLNESNSIQVGELVHDMGDLHNVFRIFWNWTGSDYSRTTSLIDADSVSIHGRADPLDLKFKGLYGGRATDSLIFQLVDSLRDRYAAPPQRITVSVLHSLNRLEVGDVVRVNYASVRDYAGSGSSIDRSFEIQNISVNHRTGQVQLELFGSTSPASALSPTTATTALPDAFYTATGTALSSVATITSGVMAAGTYALTGGSDITASGSIWYHNGDLTIPQGTTLNISGNVQLRIKGYLTINGTIIGTGGGLAGVADNNTPTAFISGNPGWVGNSRGWDGIDAQQDYNDGNARLITVPVPVTQSKHASFPYLELAVSGNSITGLPTDLRGTGGGPGGKITSGGKADKRANGGSGAAGGAGLLTVSRGFTTGASAIIRLDGNSSSATALHVTSGGNQYYPGPGGAGGPGSFLLLLDGSNVSAPDLTNRFRASTGSVPTPPARTFLDNEGAHRYSDNEDPWAGYPDPALISNRSLAGSCLRIQFVPAPETATADQDAKPPALTDLTATAKDGFALIAWTLPVDPDSYDALEVFASLTNNRVNATKIFDGRASDFQHVTGNTAVRYYWIRSRKGRIRSDFYPATMTSSVSVAAKPPIVSGYLTNEAVAVPANSAGTVSSFSAATGAFKVYSGTTEVTTSSTFSLVSSNSLTATIDSTTGVYSATAMSADVGTATFRATYATNNTVDKVFSVTKARAGTNGTNGTNGTDGNNVAQAYAYKRAASAPSDNPGAVTFDFTTGTISTATLANGWSKTIPAGTDPLYVIVASAVSATSTDAIAANEWGSPVLLAQNGANGNNGNDGLNSATVFLYARSSTSSAPSVATAGSTTYTFSTGAVTGAPSGWTRAIPSSGGGYLWSIQATAASTSSTDTIANSEWSAPVLVAQDGTNGQNGTNAVNIQLTKSAVQLLAYADGTVPDFSAATGYLTVRDGATDVTSSATLGASGSTGVTGTINTATNTPVNGEPKGFYRVTALTNDTGTLTLSATYNSVTYTATFSVSKNKIGYEIVGSLPSTNLFAGRMVFLTTDNKLYRYNGSAWTAAVSGVDITAGTLGATAFASSIEPITIVSSVPATKSTSSIFNTSDGKLYRWNGSAYVATVPSADISGQLTDAQISALAASKVTGQLTDAQLQAIAAAKVSGQLTNSQIADIASTKITGQLTDAQLAAISAAKLTGQITSTQITDGAISTPKLAAGAVTANEIAANTITAAKIASGTITATELAAGSVTTAKIAAGAVTANEVAANAITAVKISAGAIETAKIAAGAVTADTIASNAITAAKIEAGAVSTAKLAAGAVTAEKITAGSITGDRLAANTITASQIAANAITSSQIAANTITAGQIAAGAIGADQIAANAISTNKLAVGDFSVQARNTSFEEGDVAWSREGGWTISNDSSNARTGSWVAKNSVSGPAALRNAQLIATNPGEVFYVEAWLKHSGASGGGSYVRLTGQNAAGTEISNQAGNTVSSGTTTYTKSSGTFTVPAGVFIVKVEVVSDISGGTAYADDVRIIRASNAVLIEDGAISATKLSANSVTADKIDAGAITTAKLAANSVTAAKLESDLVLASTIKTASSGYRTEISNTGDFPIWYGTGTKNTTNGLFYVKTDGTVFFKGTIGAGSVITQFRITSAGATGSASGFAASGTVSATGSVSLENGTSPYTYSWVHQVTFSGNTPSISSSTSSAPNFSATVSDAVESNSQWLLTVTDASGNVATFNAYVYLIWTDLR